MPSSEREARLSHEFIGGAEAARISRQLAELFRAAQERLGLTGALVAFDTWANVDVLKPVLTADFVAEITKITRALRGVSRDLAARYYNLIRALGTGYAFPDINQNFLLEEASLEELYAALAESLNEVITATTLDISVPDTEVPEDDSEYAGKKLDDRLEELEDSLLDMFQQTFPKADEHLAKKVVLEDWDWEIVEDEKANLEDLLADIERDAVNALEEIVAKELASERTMADSLERIADRADARGAVVAGLVDADTIKQGREMIFATGHRDERRVSWMRVTGAHPCAFCTMLASRGAVYKTAESAGFGNLYHTHCHCSQVPVFTNAPSYAARDDYFMKNWKPVTKGASGKGALKLWRTWLTQQYKAGKVPEQDLFGPARPSTPPF